MTQLKIDLVYREKGEKKSRQVLIEFVSNYMRRQITEYFQLAYQVKYNWDRINDIISEVSGLRTAKPEGYKDAIDKLNVEKTELTEEILKHNNSGLVDRNVNLLIELLKDNGVKDEKLFDPAFWDKCVEPGQVIEILAKALNKDTGDKKKVVF